jgi:hypothetical protein
MECFLRQIAELLQKNYPITSSSSAWLRYKCLIRQLTVVMFEVSNFVWEEERVWHKFVVDWEEAL